ncbi:NLRC3 [Symbiodinium natans]|uniref:NLRC3 protein n=1 Tax=Symbiodinium natans TaxID=878477 RepID=A0A812RGJ9_9DINO|nr:NLRC3 [Symbiodinium natans]
MSKGDGEAIAVTVAVNRVKLACIPDPESAWRWNVEFVEEPFLPTVSELQEMDAEETTARWHFWVFVMLCIVAGTMTLGTALLKCAQRQGYTTLDGGPVAFKGTTLKVLLGLSLTCTMSASFAALAWSFQSGRLSKDTGVDWEVYAGLLLCNGLAMVLQALVMARRLPSGKRYGTTAFAQACVAGMAPILSDQYDTFKDIMFAFICFQSDKEEIQNMGVACLAYLVIIHVFCFFVEDLIAELVSSHLAVLLLTPDAGDSVKPGEELVILLYKQLTPTKRFLLLLENVPQALGALFYLRREGGSTVVAVLSLAIPAMQVLLTFVLYHPVREQVAGYYGRKLRTLVTSGDELLARRIWREADFENDEGLFHRSLPWMHPARDPEALTRLSKTLLGVWKAAVAPDDVALDFEKMDISGDLQGLGIGASGLVQALCTVLEKGTFTELNISSNSLRDEHMKALCAVLEKCGSLKDFNVSNNSIGPDGAKAICRMLTQSSLKRLDVSGNGIGDEGSDAIAKCVESKSDFENLGLEFNDITDHGVEAK